MAHRKKNKVAVQDLNGKAQHFADLFIATEGTKSAEILTLRILEKIRATVKRLEKKYGEE